MSIFFRALIRAGRFDTRINTTLPDVRARHKILEVHASKVKLHKGLLVELVVAAHDLVCNILEVSLETVARTTSGFSGKFLKSFGVVVDWTLLVCLLHYCFIFRS